MKAPVFPLLHAAALAAALVMPGVGAFAQATSPGNPGLMGQAQGTGAGSNATGDGQVAMPFLLRTLQELRVQESAAVTRPALPAPRQDGVPKAAAPSRTRCWPVPGPGVG